jgi:hypothetical protein
VPGARRLVPPLTEENWPLAVLFSPPLTEELSPLAVLVLPPQTEELPPVTVLRSPPLIKWSGVSPGDALCNHHTGQVACRLWLVRMLEAH